MLTSVLFMIYIYAELHPHIVADAFYNGEIENEIRQLASEGWQVTDFSFRSDSDRERIMEEIENIRCQRIYPHNECTADCKERGMIVTLH